MALARLRIPTGWQVCWNTLSEPIGSIDLPPENDLTEDLLLLNNQRRGISIDLSWLPEFVPTGRFVLTACRLEDDAIQNRDSAIRVVESRSYSEIRMILEDWLVDETLTTSRL